MSNSEECQISKVELDHNIPLVLGSGIRAQIDSNGNEPTYSNLTLDKLTKFLDCIK